jgi:hypothetical protein
MEEEEDYAELAGEAGVGGIKARSGEIGVIFNASAEMRENGTVCTY